MGSTSGYGSNWKKKEECVLCEGQDLQPQSLHRLEGLLVPQWNRSGDRWHEEGRLPEFRRVANPCRRNGYRGGTLAWCHRISPTSRERGSHHVGRCGGLPGRCVGRLKHCIGYSICIRTTVDVSCISIYIVLHECVIAFSILYIFRLCDYGCRDDDFLSMPDVHVSRISPCMLFNHWSAYADWSSIPVQSASSKKKSHLNYLFVMTIQLLLFTLPSKILFFVKLLWIRSLSWSLLFATFGHWLHWYHETDGSIPIQSVSICVDKNHPLYYFILWQWYEWYSGVIWHDFVWC